MTNYVGREIVPLREPESDPDADRSLADGGELSARAGSSNGGAAFRGSERSPGTGKGCAGRRTPSGTDAALSPQPALFRAQGARSPSSEARLAGARAGGERSAAAASSPPDRKADLTITAKSSLEQVAQAVGDALRRAGIRAVLTGGACAGIHSGGEYQSEDLDLIVQSASTRQDLDRAMATVGFVLEGDRYVHPESPFFVEFPRGPLSIGEDVRIEPISIKTGNREFLALSATDSCRDRLAAFYHWRDRSSLETAVLIAARNRVDMRKIEEWSRGEGAESGFREFQDEVKAARKRRGKREKRPRGTK